jgi:phosphoribosylaminoimidazole (AIR) synthetase
MRKVFNLGIGFTVIIPHELEGEVLKFLKGAKKIGKIA